MGYGATIIVCLIILFGFFSVIYEIVKKAIRNELKDFTDSYIKNTVRKAIRDEMKDFLDIYSKKDDEYK